jgi:hypothetical protein
MMQPLQCPCESSTLINTLLPASWKQYRAGSAAEAATDDSPVHLWAHDSSGNQYFFAAQRSTLPAPLARRSSNNSLQPGDLSTRPAVETFNVPIVPVTIVPSPVGPLPQLFSPGSPLGMVHTGEMRRINMVSAAPGFEGGLHDGPHVAMMFPTPEGVHAAAQATRPQVGGGMGGPPGTVELPRHAPVDFGLAGGNAPSEGGHLWGRIGGSWIQTSGPGPHMSLPPQSLPIQPLEPLGPWMFNPKPDPNPSDAPWGRNESGPGASVNSDIKRRRGKTGL